MNKKAYVTYLGTDDYLIGTLCLHSSLKSVKARYPLLIICSNNISAPVLDALSRFGLTYLKLEKKIIVNAENKGKYERWYYTFDKLQVFNLTGFEKIVFLDSDMMLVHNIDHLFESPHMSAVVADVYDQPDCNQLNSGLMVIEPSALDYQGIMKIVMRDNLSQRLACGDQDFIRAFFEDWPQKPELRLPLGYNLYWTNVRRYDKKKEGEIYNIHFVYNKKPWQLKPTQVLRRLLKVNTLYLLKYMRMVYLFRFLLRKDGIKQ